MTNTKVCELCKKRTKMSNLRAYEGYSTFWICYHCEDFLKAFYNKYGKRVNTSFTTAIYEIDLLKQRINDLEREMRDYGRNKKV